MGVRAIFQLATPWSSEEVFDLGFEQRADVMVLTHLDYPAQRLTRYGHDNWTLEAGNYLSTVAAPTGLAVTANTPSSGTGYVASTTTYTVTTIDAETGQESLPAGGVNATNDLSMKGNNNQLFWNAVAGAERYNVYRLGGGSYGYIGTTESTTFTDDNIAPDFSQSFPLHKNPFEGTNNYPACVAFWQQRAVYARTLNKPNGIFASQSANLFNFNAARPIVASDAATFAVSGRGVNAIMHLVPLKNLIAFTTDAVFSISGGPNSAVFSPLDIDISPEGYRAASRVRPVVIDDVIFYNTSKGGSIRTLGYQFEADGYKGNDLTVFAPHLFRSITVTDMTWAEFPHNLLSVVGSDGKVRGLTWQAEQDVWGWSLHETRGAVESVCTVSEGGEDVTYYVVKRTIGGVERRFVEYSASIRWEDVADCNYLDSSRVYDGEPVDNIRGMDHLEGETVTVLADGAVYMDYATIENGSLSVDLPVMAQKIVVGLSYESWIRTLPMPSENGAGEPQTVAGATVRVLKSRGLEVGQGKDLPPGQEEPVTSDDELFGTPDEIETRDLEALGEPTRLFSGDLHVDLEAGDWRDATVVVRQRYPLPMHVTRITPDVV